MAIDFVAPLTPDINPELMHAAHPSERFDAISYYEVMDDNLLPAHEVVSALTRLGLELEISLIGLLVDPTANGLLPHAHSRLLRAQNERLRRALDTQTWFKEPQFEV